MPNENVTPEDVAATLKSNAEDLKANAELHVEEAVEATKEKFESAKNVIANFSLNEKLLLTGAAALVASVVIQKLAGAFRRDVTVVEADTVVVQLEDISEV
jgi:hypothetical protein